MTKIMHRDFPSEPTPCKVAECVYLDNGICDEPNINTFNGDAACYRWSPKNKLEFLDVNRVRSKAPKITESAQAKKDALNLIRQLKEEEKGDE